MPTASATRNGRRAPTPSKPILAGGAVVTREHPTRGTEVVIIHRKRYDDWTLPKGKLDSGESLPACAVREVFEETGVAIRLGVPLDTIRYEAPTGPKKVDYWGATVLSTVRRAPDAEVDVVSWLPIRAAMGRLTYAYDHFLLAQYLEQPATTPLLIVRHAKAMDRKDWSRKDSARPINTRGRRQAKLLVPMLAAYGVTRVVSSTSTRCLSTVQPYTRSRDLPVEAVSRLSEEEGVDNPKEVAKLVRSIRSEILDTGQPTAICVHRPVLPHILDALDIVPTSLVTGEFLVAHLTAEGEVHALERHRPQA